MKASDGVVIVVKNNSTTYPELSRTVEVIKRTNAKILGVILNRVKPHETRKGRAITQDTADITRHQQMTDAKPPLQT